MTEIREAAVRIPLADGRHLHARLWRPAENGRWPAILESSPYRAGDFFRPRADGQLAWFAQHGYAVLAIDIAGSGNSPGLLRDEYEPGEIGDLVAAIDWASKQDWCDGGVGLSGLSWSAFAALRASARQPPALKAMVLGAVSEDSWRTDIHYLGGVPYTAQVDWAGVMLMLNSLPPDPAQFAGDWRAEWIARLENNRPYLLRWLAHPEHDSYWTDRAAPAHGTVPLLLYCGCADKYAASVLRIARAWRGPLRTILGPWEHTSPDTAARGPRIDFRQEALRWWNTHLKSGEVRYPPALSVWTGAPDARGDMANGAWHGVDAHPTSTMRLQGPMIWQTLPRRTPRPSVLTADLYEDAPAPFDLAAFRAAGALIVEGATWPNARDFGGISRLVLKVRSTAPHAHVIARLIDLGPDGTAVRMVTGAARLANTEEHNVRLDLPAVGWRLLPGHKVVVVLCTDGWPNFWPPPHEAAVEIGDVKLTMPTIASHSGTPDFEPALKTPNAGVAALQWLKPVTPPPAADGALVHDAVSAAHHLTATGTDYVIVSRFAVAPDGGRSFKTYHVAFERPGWSIRIDTRLEVSSTPDAYRINWRVAAREGETEIHRTEQTAHIPRTVV
jgi:predicted acyl esterase